MAFETRPAFSSRRWGALIATTLGRVALGFQFQTLPALAPALTVNLGLGLSEIGVLTGLYMLPGVFVALLGGLMLQHMSVRGALVIGLAAMVGSGLLSLATSEFHGLSAMRLLGGFGAVLVTVATLKGLYDWFPPSELSLANGVSGGAQPFGMGCALLIFSTMGAGAAWQAGLFATGVVSALALAAVVTLTPSAGPSLPPSKASGLPKIPSHELVMLMLAGLVAALFVGCFYAFLSLFPSYLHSTGWSSNDAGLILGALGWAPIVFSPIGGLMATRFRRVVPVAGICIFIWGGAVVALAVFGVKIWVIGLMLVFGPLPIGPVMSLAAQAVAPERRGVGSGIFMACIFLGTSALPPAAAWFGEWAPEIGGTSETTAVLFCGVLFLASLLPLALFEAAGRRAPAPFRAE